MMGACQDCWVSRADGSKLRACSTFIEEGMVLLSDVPGVMP
jgi:predicted molibdopterin-dependent oxidoreductase YjgC